MTDILDGYKELEPVVYGEKGIKFLKTVNSPGAMCFNIHWHERIELLHVKSGCLEVYLDSKHISVHPGELLIIMPKVNHCGFAGKQGVYYNMFAFDPVKFKNETLSSNRYLDPLIKNKVNFCSLTSNHDAINAINELEHLMAKESNHHPLYVIGKIYELIGIFYQNCMETSEKIQKSHDNFDQVIEYIDSHYTENISAKSVSQIFGYDESYFCRRFKETTGTTTTRYIRFLRLELAHKLLLLNTNEIQNIAWQCGFTDCSYFSKCFKQQFGVSPTEFRAKMIQTSLAHQQ